MNEACTKIINFVTPLGGVTVLLWKGVTLWGIYYTMEHHYASILLAIK